MKIDWTEIQRGLAAELDKKAFEIPGMNNLINKGMGAVGKAFRGVSHASSVGNKAINSGVSRIGVKGGLGAAGAGAAINYGPQIMDGVKNALTPQWMQNMPGTIQQGMAMLPMLAGLGTMGKATGGAVAGAVAKPNFLGQNFANPNSMKSVMKTGGILDALMFRAHTRVADNVLDTAFGPKQPTIGLPTDKKETHITSQDHQVKKLLANPQARAYIEDLIQGQV